MVLIDFTCTKLPRFEVDLSDAQSADNPTVEYNYIKTKNALLGCESQFIFNALAVLHLRNQRLFGRSLSESRQKEIAATDYPGGIKAFMQFNLESAILLSGLDDNLKAEAIFSLNYMREKQVFEEPALKRKMQDKTPFKEMALSINSFAPNLPKNHFGFFFDFLNYYSSNISDWIKSMNHSLHRTQAVVKFMEFFEKGYNCIDGLVYRRAADTIRDLYADLEIAYKAVARGKAKNLTPRQQKIARYMQVMSMYWYSPHIKPFIVPFESSKSFAEKVIDKLTSNKRSNPLFENVDMAMRVSLPSSAIYRNHWRDFYLRSCFADGPVEGHFAKLGGIGSIRVMQLMYQLLMDPISTFVFNYQLTDYHLPRPVVHFKESLEMLVNTAKAGLADEYRFLLANCISTVPEDKTPFGSWSSKISVMLSHTTDINNLVESACYNIPDMQVLCKLGEGAQGIVFKVRHKPSDEILKVKVYKDPEDKVKAAADKEKITVDQIATRRFKTVDTKLRDYTHISKLYHFSKCINPRTGNETFYVVSDYVDGGAAEIHENDKYCIRPDLMDKSTHAGILNGVCYALETMHKAGLILRDLKLSNILVSLDHHTVLVDDLETLANIDQVIKGERLTQGSDRYAAPEVMQDITKASQSSDIYSLAVCTLYLHTGKPTLMLGINNAPTETEYNKQLEMMLDSQSFSASLKTFFQQALSWRPYERYANPSDLLKNYALSGN